MARFEYTAENLQKIKSINAQLRKEELRARMLYHRLKPGLDRMAADGLIDDYNFLEQLSLFTDARWCNRKYGVEYGDPIYEINTCVYQLYSDESFNENWNELRGHIHPVSNLHFCYLMHCLVFDSHLEWRDICAIESIWLEFKVDYQFTTDKERATDLRRWRKNRS